MSMPDLSRFGAVLSQVSESDTELRDIPLTEIAENPANFYPPVSREETLALADSIQANGLLEPLVVVPAGEQYRLISGHNRFRALRYLCVNGDGKAYTTALCRVLPPMDEAKELAAIIEFNRQRKKTPGILAEEARRLEKSYRKRRDAGENLPGRIRDRIAADLGVSPAKIGNLDIIKNGLKDTQLIVWWQCGMMSEAAALAAARMEPEAQDALRHWLMTEGQKPSLGNVREFYTIYPKIDHDCPRAGKPCPNARAMYQHFCRGGNWEGCCGCCDLCLKRDTCEVCCPYAEHKALTEAESELEAPALEVGSRDPEEIARSIAPEDEAEAERHVFRVLPPEPEGQMTLACWMPGCADPGAPGEFAVLVDLGGDGLYRAFMAWNGTAWEMLPSHQRPELPVGWWLRLPPVPGEEEI